jgi:hypothetical protein
MEQRSEVPRIPALLAILMYISATAMLVTWLTETSTFVTRALSLIALQSQSWILVIPMLRTHQRSQTPTIPD